MEKRSPGYKCDDVGVRMELGKQVRIIAKAGAGVDIVSVNVAVNFVTERLEKEYYVNEVVIIGDDCMSSERIASITNLKLDKVEKKFDTLPVNDNLREALEDKKKKLSDKSGHLFTKEGNKPVIPVIVFIVRDCADHTPDIPSPDVFKMIDEIFGDTAATIWTSYVRPCFGPSVHDLTKLVDVQYMLMPSIELNDTKNRKLGVKVLNDEFKELSRAVLQDGRLHVVTLFQGHIK